MTRKEALTDLLGAIDASNFDRWSTAKTPFTSPQKFFIQRAYNGSLDAAKALHEAVLPNMMFLDLLRRGNRYTANISLDVFDNTASGVSSTLARSWLIAIIKALIAECDE